MSERSERIGANDLFFALCDLYGNPYPHDLLEIRRLVKEHFGGDEDAAQKKMEAWCSDEAANNATQRWLKAREEARRCLSLYQENAQSEA